MLERNSNKMKIVTKLIIWLLLLIFVVTFSAYGINASSNNNSSPGNEVNNDRESPLTYILSLPKTDGDASVEKVLAHRRSRRSFQHRAILEDQLSQILWAAYGITSPRPVAANSRDGLRTAPSAGALYPLEIYVIIGNVEGIEPGVYRYISEEHKIVRIIDGDVRNELSEAALGQRMLREASVTVFYSGVFSRTTGRYGERGIKYVYVELGHSAQNVYLQTEALGLGTCAIGAFTDSRISSLLNLPANEEPLYLMPIGYY
jgi:SagB-type dehydrogenase family enzyme